MSVTVKIPTQLRAATGGQAELEVEGGTVGEVLDAVFDAHGGLRDRITQDGDLRRFVNVYVSGEDIRFQQGLETSINDGDEVTILPAVAGGRSPFRPLGPYRGHNLGLSEATRRHSLRRPRDAAARADRVGAEGAGRDRRPADPLARDSDLRGAGVRPLPAGNGLHGRRGS